ncbi:TWiK family of potassium channels protein 7-like [Macrobrachium rosenbergii]|uniref:TWiK family of potassium channels protein 7-like n=1 Tax=Macrobrachium rosenbergii TaxID=79674 RepID=UPI0034D46857
MEIQKEEGENLYKQRKSLGAIFLQLMFSHFGLFIVVAFYAVLGAYAFVEIELPYEERLYEIKRTEAEAINNTINYMANLFWYYQDKNWTYYDFNETVYKDLKRMEDYIIRAVKTTRYDGEVKGWNYAWTIPNSLLFTMTIMSTIGYGHIAPKTKWGKVFCVVYAMTGCPLLLVFLGNLGSAMADSFIYLYSRCFCRTCRSRRNLEELPPNASKKQRKLLIDDVVGKEEYMPTEKINVPITLNLVLLFIYIMLGAVLFSFWENWDLTSSSYFTFVTISTIGFGDMVPGAALLDKASIDAAFKMLVCIVYILLGMALLSMCINLMQEQLVDKWKWMAKEIGLRKKNNEVKAKKDTSVKKPKEKKKKKKKATGNQPPSAPPKPLPPPSPRLSRDPSPLPRSGTPDTLPGSLADL